MIAVEGKRGQIVFEFIFWVGVALAIGVFLLFLMSDVLHDELMVRKYDYYESLADDIRDELILASEVNPGYVRELDLSVDDDYTVETIKGYLVLGYEDNYISVRIPETDGSIQKGNNTIRNIDGRLVITNE